MNLDNTVKQRRAVEALRSGMPNRDAVAALGCAQPQIEEMFRQQLERARQGVVDGSKGSGILVEGDFGTGKSHLLEYLMHLALRENFVCSKIVISKETPFYDPVKIYRAAVETAVVPGKRGDALTEIATKLDFNSQTYADLYLRSLLQNP
jgi:predicted ATPase